MEDWIYFIAFIIFGIISLIGKLASPQKNKENIEALKLNRKPPAPSATPVTPRKPAPPSLPVTAALRQKMALMESNKIKESKKTTGADLLQSHSTGEKKSLISPEEPLPVSTKQKNIDVFPPPAVRQSASSEFAVMFKKNKKTAIVFHEILSKPKCFDY